MTVRYSWTEDGIIEIATADKTVLENDTQCDHCDTLIAKGETAHVLSVKDGSRYILHESCFKKSCDVIG